jgi:threonylcarbamoyladenosine tRNA methylthiotransferase MtaB
MLNGKVWEMGNKYTYNIATLGCKVNQAESYALQLSLSRRGWALAQESPEIYFVNTCAVTQASEGKSRRIIKRIMRENPESRLIVTGCYASRNPEEIRESLREGIDLIVAQGDKETIPGLLEKRDNPASGFSHRTRAFLKIQDGCANYCSYCIVPFLRGAPRSRPLHDVLKEARELAGSGYKEIVLVGINLGNYTELGALLNKMSLMGALLRIRLSSLEPNHITDELLSRIKDSRKVCPHFHIPLQSGSDKVLKEMRRRYDSRGYLEIVKKIRKAFKNPGVTTDIIVGFPGESEADFEETLNVAKSAEFSKIHIFPYSPRPGTKADGANEPVKLKTVKERCGELKSLGERLALGYKKQFVGKRVEVLTEGKGESGFTPEYVKARLKHSYPDKVNKVIDVLIDRAANEYLEGDICL